MKAYERSNHNTSLESLTLNVIFESQQKNKKAKVHSKLRLGAQRFLLASSRDERVQNDFPLFTIALHCSDDLLANRHMLYML